MSYTCPDHPHDHDRSCCPDRTIYTAKSGLWNYTHPFSPKDRVAIHSKRQFEAECRRRGLRHVVKDDLLKRGQPYRPDPTPLPESTVADAVREALPRARQIARQGGP